MVAGKKAENVATALAEPEQFALARLLAKSFAVYTVELLARLEDYERQARHGEAADAGAEDALKDAPQWVRESYERAQDPDAESDSDEQVRARIARNALLEALRERGWSQAQLARKLKKQPTVISRIFRDPTRSRVTTLRQIATALGVDLSDIL